LQHPIHELKCINKLLNEAEPRILSLEAEKLRCEIRHSLPACAEFYNERKFAKTLSIGVRGHAMMLRQKHTIALTVPALAKYNGRETKAAKSPGQ
jgi:hypothetical protein